MSKKTFWIVAGAVVAALPAVGDVTPTGPFNEVAETGLPAAGLPAGITWSAIQTPMVNETRALLFASELAGGTPVNGVHASGIFLGPIGALQLVARTGDAAPGTGGATWSDLIGGALMLRAGGRIAFPAELLGQDAAHNGGVWAGTLGNLALVAREGDPAPGTTAVFAGGTQDRNFQDVLHLAMNDVGTVALLAKLSGAGVTTANDRGLFVGMPGGLALIARLGSPAPGAGGATYFNDGTETFSSPSITPSGNVLFRAHLTGTGVTGTNADGLWYGVPSAPALVVRSGQPVVSAGIPPSSTLIGLGAARPVVNDAGQILFEAPAFDGATLTQAVWFGLPASLQAIATVGAPAPGDAHAATFSGLFQQLRLNSQGHVVFRAGLSTSGSDFGLYGWDGATLRRLARSGDQAPGMPTGETFSGLASEDVYVNSQGQVLFADATKPSLTQGVWLADLTTGNVTLVASAGVNATVAGATKFVIDAQLFRGWDTAGSASDGRCSPLADDGTYAILAQFLDGHLAVLTNAAGGGGGACGDIAACLVSLGATLPDPLTAADSKSKKVAKSLAKLLATVQKNADKAATLTGTKQAKKYAAARKALTKLLTSAAKADEKGRLGVALAGIQGAGNGTLGVLPQ